MNKSELTQFVREIASELDAELGGDLVDADDLDDNDTFESAATTLAESDMPGNELLALCRDRDELVTCIALAAVGHRRHVPAKFEQWAWRTLKNTTTAQDTYIFRALLRHGTPPLIGRALAAVKQGVGHELIAWLVSERMLAGEPFDESVLDASVSPHDAEDLDEVVDACQDILGAEFCETYAAWRAGSVDTEFLSGIGRMWTRPYDSPPALLSGRRAEIVDLIAERLAETPRRSVLLVGQHGVGKTSLFRAATGRVEDLSVFEAAATQLQADSMSGSRTGSWRGTRRAPASSSAVVPTARGPHAPHDRAQSLRAWPSSASYRRGC